MKNLLLLVFILASFHDATAQWSDLFNGKDLKGWKILNGEAPFTVEDGLIVGRSVANSPNSFLCTQKDYTNFILEYEMIMDDGLNSGVQIRSKSQASYRNGRVHGPQVETEDSGRGWSGGIFDEARKGWRYPLDYNPTAKEAFKKGEWNSFKVLAFNSHIMTWVNGIPAANLVEEETETGFIGLQVHGIGNNTSLAGKSIKWKNIRIREITADDFDSYKGMKAPEVSYLINQLTEHEKYQGWKLLWDGETNRGWRGVNMDHFPESGWTVSNGVLELHATPEGEKRVGDIVTGRKYRNFIFEIDFSITKGANSGIKYFIDTEYLEGKGSSIGPEYQILCDEYHPDAKEGVGGNRTMASLYDIMAPNGREYNPFLPREKYMNGYDQWNRARIVVEGKKVQHYLNGIKMLEYERDTHMWRALVAFSKYRNHPNFGEFQDGHILLQDHFDNVKFRNIKIKEL
jgi:hypothetical protein